MKLCPKCQKQFSDDANFCPVDAARLAPLETPSVATDGLAAKYELGERLGGSRTGAVHRATEKATGQPAAVKLIAPAVLALPGLAQRLERELKQLERVQAAGVAKVLASGKRGDDTWVALELLDGAQTLTEAVAARGPMPTDSASSLIEVVGEALIQAAQVGVVHRDLAPKNILFASGEMKLINFSLPMPPAGEGAPGVSEYVAPEQHDGKPVDQRSNLYSLGALYYFVLTGQAVRSEDGAVVPPSSLAPVPPPVEALVLRALDKNPTKRFLTVRQFVDEVVRVARAEAELPEQAAEPAPVLVQDRPAKPRSQVVETLLGVRSGEPMVPATILDRSPWAPPPDIGPAPKPPAQIVEPPATSTQIGLGSVPPAAAPVAAAPAAVAAAPAVAASAAAASPAAVAPAVAAPGVAAPVVPPPLLAAPLLGAAGKRSSRSSGDSKGKFRETMWFKKGEMDAQAAEAAAADHARTGNDAGPDRVDSMPIDERYKDDGSLSRADKDRYSLRTGATLMTTAVRESGSMARMPKGSDDALIDELKGGRNKIIAAIAVGLVVVILIIFLVAR